MRIRQNDFESSEAFIVMEVFIKYEIFEWLEPAIALLLTSSSNPSVSSKFWTFDDREEVVPDNYPLDTDNALRVFVPVDSRAILALTTRAACRMHAQPGCSFLQRIN